MEKKSDFNIDSLFNGYDKISDKLETVFRWYHEQHEQTDEHNVSIDALKTMIPNDDYLRYVSSWGKKALTSEDFFKPSYNVAVVPHIPYTPTFKHSHDFYEMTFAFSGLCHNQMENEDIVMGHDCLVLVAPGTRHSIITLDNQTKLMNYLIKPEFFRLLFSSEIPQSKLSSDIFYNVVYGNSEKGFIFIDLQDSPELKKMLIEIAALYYSESRYARALISLKTMEFFVRLLEFHDQNHPQESAGNAAGKFLAIETIVRKLRNNYQSLCRADLAEEFGYSERQIARILKSYTGKGFSELVQQYRMDDAANYLKTTNLTIAQISEKVGFTDISSLHRCFKNEYGMTPSEYRKNNRS